MFQLLAILSKIDKYQHSHYHNDSVLANNKIEEYYTQTQYAFQKSVFEKPKSQVLLTFGHNANSLSSISFMYISVCHLVYQFLRGERETQNLLKLNQVWIVPVVNPDGYEYVRNIYSNNQFALIEEIELIIKNRNPAQTQCAAYTLGVNLRNNYGYKFGLDNLGSDSDPCKQFYRGKDQITENESRAIFSLVQMLTNNTFSSDQKLLMALNIDSHRKINSFVSPNNYDSDKDNDYLRRQDLKDFIYYSDFNDILKIGNSAQVFQRPNNGDIDDWLFHQYSVLSLSYYLAQVSQVQDQQKGTVFLKSDQIEELFWYNIGFIYDVIQKGTVNIKIQLEDDNIKLCGQSYGNRNINVSSLPMCDGYQNTPYDMYLVKKVEIFNDGQVDAKGNVKFLFQSDTKIEKLYLRMSRSQQYKEIKSSIDPQTNMSMIYLSELQSYKQQSIGVILIIHQSFNVSSYEDYAHLKKLPQRNMVFLVLYEDGFGSKVSSYNYDPNLLYQSIDYDKSLINQKAKASEVLLYIYAIVSGALLLIIVPMQLQMNIFRINKNREEDEIHRAYEIEMIDKQQLILRRNDDIFEYHPNNIDPLEPNNGTNGSEENFVQKRQLNIEVPSVSYDQINLSTGRYSDATMSQSGRGLMMSTRQTDLKTFKLNEEAQQQQTQADPQIHEAYGFGEEERQRKKIKKQQQQLPDIKQKEHVARFIHDIQDLSRITEEDKGLEASILNIDQENFGMGQKMYVRQQSNDIRNPNSKKSSSQVKVFVEGPPSIKSSQSKNISFTQQKSWKEDQLLSNDNEQQKFWFYPQNNDNQHHDIDNEPEAEAVKQKQLKNQQSEKDIVIERSFEDLSRSIKGKGKKKKLLKKAMSSKNQEKAIDDKLKSNQTQVGKFKSNANLIVVEERIDEDQEHKQQNNNQYDTEQKFISDSKSLDF